jgi:hypothetical protein
MLNCQFAEQTKLEEYKVPFTALGQFPIQYVLQQTRKYAGIKFTLEILNKYAE